MISDRRMITIEKTTNIRHSIPRLAMMRSIELLTNKMMNMLHLLKEFLCRRRDINAQDRNIDSTVNRLTQDKIRGDDRAVNTIIIQVKSVRALKGQFLREVSSQGNLQRVTV